MRRSILSALLTCSVLLATVAVATADDPEHIFFPVQVTDDLEYSDTWGQARSAGRTHSGTDIMAPQMSQVYAAESGSIFAYEGDCRVGEQCYSYYLLISGDDGRSYFYVHLNNDTPGRPDGCDGAGGVDNAFSPRLAEIWREQGTLVGVRVERGEHVAYNGSSGNAGCGVDHVHFEMWDGHGWGATKVNSYPYLVDAEAAGNFWGPEGAPPAPEPTARVAGEHRLQTAIALSTSAYPDGSVQSVVIAPAFVYPEALVAAPLASVLGGPVLLTWDQRSEGRDVLADEVAAEIERLGATYAVIVGAPDRLGPELEDELAAKTSIARSSIRRLQGADRYELSREVAEEVLTARGVPLAAEDAEEAEDADDSGLPLGPDGTVGAATAEEESPPPSISPILALGEHVDEGRGWPDALAASVLAARQQVPVLLTRTDDLPGPTAALLDNEHVGEVRIAGGDAAISDAVEATINEQHDKVTRRLAGPTRYTTSQAIAAEYLGDDDVGLDQVFFATGRNYPDALAAGAPLARLGRVLVLIDGVTTEGAASTYGWARDHADAIAEAVSVGGSAAISDEVLTMIARYANWPHD